MNPKLEYYRNISGTIIKNLEKRGMEGYFVENKEEALEKLFSLMSEGSSIAYGGSMSLVEIGFFDKVKERNYNLIVREEYKTKEEVNELKAKTINADYFLMSTNAITFDGKLINVDGRGNRIGYLCYGPENVIVVTGVNKIVKDESEGIIRARNMAAPPNCVRLNKKTPCSVTGKCEDCLSSDSICCQTMITRKSVGGRIKVIIVGEELGF